ncbi:MAG: TIGR04283 family arsenosugar biosynthesis glycosyltransferase [Planctomycetaceae bacterium]
MTIAVVIPTLNEEQTLPGCLASLASLQADELVVADGGSTDRTADIARDLGATVVAASPGRGRQCNAGAAVTRSDWLLFLHADCRLHGEGGSVVATACREDDFDWGAFRHRIDSPRRALRLIEAADNFRAGWCRRPYGDQGLLVRRGHFDNAGGYPDVPILEDVLLARQLRSVSRFQLLPATLLTDARRWKQRGILKTTALNWAIIAGAACGVSPERLAKWYRGK